MKQKAGSFKGQWLAFIGSELPGSCVPFEKVVVKQGQPLENHAEVRKNIPQPLESLIYDFSSAPSAS